VAKALQEGDKISKLFK